MLESLYDTTETSNVNYVGYISEGSRFDFAIVYSNQFFGKPLVICMQTGRSAPLCADDLKDLELLRSRFFVSDDQAIDALRSMLGQRLPKMQPTDQY